MAKGGGLGSPGDLIDGLVTGVAANIVWGLLVGFAIPIILRGGK